LPVLGEGLDLSVLSELGFPDAQKVQGRASIADLFRPRKRCGIYVLHFSNGELYAGQAIDVTRRYAQHRIKYQDIDKISFKQVPRSRLNKEERTIIWGLEHDGQVLRNITFASIPKGESDFDLIMSPAEQTRWLEDFSYIDNGGDRIVNSALRRRYRDRFQKFLDAPNANEALDVLKIYAKVSLPALRRGEVSFWACSCWPAPNIYARVNINWQEVFNAFYFDDTFRFSFQVANSRLTGPFGDDLELLFERYPGLKWQDLRYDPGGSDQIRLLIDGSENAKAFITDKDILGAIRLFNLRLMRKGPCTFGRYHCTDLADTLVSD
jgi:hypothetical protein